MEVGGIGPIELASLKERCVRELERLIISGRLPIGSALPPERGLAASLGVSRPVVHEALVELAAKGFIRVEPRRGSRVADFYRRGTLAILESLVLRSEGDFSPRALEDILAFRLLVETECSRLAAAGRGRGYLERLRAELGAEGDPPFLSPKEAAERDFEFHLLLAESSGNLVYPLIINGFKPAYLSLSSRFYGSIGPSAPERTPVVALQRAIVDAIGDGDEARAAEATRALLEHGREILMGRRDRAPRDPGASP